MSVKTRAHVSAAEINPQGNSNVIFVGGRITLAEALKIISLRIWQNSEKNLYTQIMLTYKS